MCGSGLWMLFEREHVKKERKKSRRGTMLKVSSADIYKCTHTLVLLKNENEK